MQNMHGFVYDHTHIHTHTRQTLIALRKFYKEHYTATRMRLCVLGKESLRELEEAVRK